MKRCADCGQAKPSSDYHSNVRCADGLAFYCKICAATRKQSRRRRGISPRRKCPETLKPGMKWCPDCQAVKDLAEFPRNRNTGTGRAPYCKPCHNVRGKLSKLKVGGSRTYHLKRRYGITASDAEAMLLAQKGLCALCRAAPAVHVDHDHVTGKVRGLLCFNCNGGLGQFKDRIDVLQAAVDYLTLTPAARPRRPLESRHRRSTGGRGSSSCFVPWRRHRSRTVAAHRRCLNHP